ncbi:MAG: hypothetical protein IK138_04860 [Lachnospiraceae bacterium]|nr:hypothetical protein [Lachnospiraceae bacterium]
MISGKRKENEVNAYKAALTDGLFDWRTYKMESGNPAVYRCFLKAWKEYIKQRR